MCMKLTGQQRAMRSGLMDMILAGIGIVTGVVDIVELNRKILEPDVTMDEKSETNASLILLYILIAISIVRFIMGLILRRGARQREEKMVRAWFYVSIILWIIQIAEFATKLSIGTFVLWSTISNTLAILIRIAVMYVVYKFINEIQEERTPLLET